MSQVRIVIGSSIVAVIVLVGFGLYANNAKRKAAQEQALKTRIKAEVMAEIKAEQARGGAELRESQPPPTIIMSTPSQTLRDSYPLVQRGGSPVVESARGDSEALKQSELKSFLLQRLSELDWEARNGGGFVGSGQRAREKIEILRALADIEASERGASPASIESARQRRANDDLRQEVDRLRKDVDDEKRRRTSEQLSRPVGSGF